MKVEVRLTLIDSLTQVCLDTGCIMFLIDRAFLKSQMLKILLKTLQTLINVRGIENSKHSCQEYAFIDLYLPGILINKSVVTHLTRDIHVVDDLRVKLLLGMNIMSSKRISTNVTKRLVTVDSCRDLLVKLSIIFKTDDRTRRVIHSKARVIIESHALLQISIRVTILSSDRDFSFESEYNDNTKDLQRHDAIYAHIVDCNMLFVHVRNDEDNSLIISRHTRLRTITEIEDESCYSANSEDHGLAGAKHWKSHSNVVVFTQQDSVRLINGITIYGNENSPICKELKEVCDSFTDL